MASISQRQNGVWQAVIRRRGYPLQSKTFDRRGDAVAWARAVESEMDRGSFVSAARAERTTLEDLIKAFEQDFAPHHYRARGWEVKLKALRKRLGPLVLVALTPQVCAKYRDDRLRDPHSSFKDPIKARRVSTATVKNELDMLSKVLEYGQKECGIPLPAGNPVRQIRLPRGSRSRDRRLNAEELDRLMDACRQSKNPWLAPAAALAIETAMRRGELLQLEWKHVDKARRLAMLPDPTKIKNGQARAVPLSTRALSILDTLPRSLSRRVIPVEAVTLSAAFEFACKRAKIEDFHWHDLRHEAISRLAERGDLSLLEMAAVSGHKTLQMLKRYTHIQAEGLARKLG